MLELEKTEFPILGGGQLRKPPFWQLEQLPSGWLALGRARRCAGGRCSGAAGLQARLHGRRVGRSATGGDDGASPSKPSIANPMQEVPALERPCVSRGDAVPV